MVMMNKMNCWEYKKCGCEKDAGCPAAAPGQLDGVHGGRYAGRACWVIRGTRCDSELQGGYSGKLARCSKCGFYSMVRKEERALFMVPAVLLHIAQGAFGADKKTA